MFTSQCLDDIKATSSEQLKHSDSLPPTALLNNQYEILYLEDICRGSFIYKAIDLKRDIFVTIKEFFPRDAIGYEEQLYLVRDFENLSLRLMDETPLRQKQYEELLENFVEEANYLEKVSHGSPILKIQESFYDNNTAYLVFNYNKWPTLQDFIDAKYHFNTDQLKWLTKELVDIISRFHKRDIVHRNINPKNIYIKQDEILIDSIGTCDYLKDIKVFDADSYECRYYAPEIIMHNGTIGTWTDVYAIGKVVIDIITCMHESGDYFEGLNMLPGDLKDVYQKLAYNAIQFDHRARTKSAVDLKKALSMDDDSSYFRTPKAVIAMIAMISFISCVVLVWQYNNDTMMADDYILIQEEEVPLGQVVIEDKPCYFLLDHLVMTDTSLDIRWLKKEHVLISHLEIINSNKEILTIDLLEHQVSVNISSFDLPEDKYLVKLYYKISDELLYETMHLEIKE